LNLIEIIKSLGKKLINTAEKMGFTVNDEKTEDVIVFKKQKWWITTY